MSLVKKSISMTSQQGDWSRAQIESGHYDNESEVIRELIRERQIREQESEQEIQAIRQKLIQAEQSGFAQQSAAEILQEIKTEIGNDGELSTES